MCNVDYGGLLGNDCYIYISELHIYYTQGILIPTWQFIAYEFAILISHIPREQRLPKLNSDATLSDFVTVL